MPKSRVTIVGLGLIGGSIGLALKQAKLEIEIVGHDKDSGVAGRAVKRGAVDKTEWNLYNACNGAGMIILALPLAAIKDTLTALKEYAQPGVIITDTAMTKMPTLEWARDLPAGVQFVGGNPVLKTQRPINGRGIDAADPALFQGATYCVVATPSATAQAIDTVANLAGALGAKAYFLDAAEHDGLMAGIQHFPAFIATALASAVVTSQGWRDLGKLAGGKFRALTELVPNDKQDARETFLTHQADLNRWIDLTIAKLEELRALAARGDAAALETVVEQIDIERNRWLSGKFDETDAPQTDWSEVRTSTARMFLGGLADRKPPAKR